ncbi:MAG: DNA polymerase III subunit gamma/tau [Armatimonadetes bacterium]|nr:DNA polymerase III subunit gamma/tau [Armatimonadota bacterium]
MAYVALYRKYRSQSFSELMGQEQVTRTLQNAIKSRRIAHAYLFHGARGCGKTSTARLLARALNCTSQDVATPEPCGECHLCISIRDGSCMDVVEIDAASKTGIDDVREQIIENVQYAPTEARYKVYIIDEVHDLSSKAFDALLKTLEEPPAHVVFILATTEWHKVPITIRSRCQPFQFKRGSLQDLMSSVQSVITAEGYSADEEAVLAVARGAEGSWRDALSLLEQVIAYSEGHISAQTVHKAIGSVGNESLIQIVSAIASGEMERVLTAAGDVVESGTDVRQALTTLSGYLRDLLLISAGAKKTAQAEMSAERYTQMAGQASAFTPTDLLQMLEVLSAAERDLRFTNQQRVLLERTLLRLMPANFATNTRVVVETKAAPSVLPPSPPPSSMAPAFVPRPQRTAVAPVREYPQEEIEEEAPLPVEANRFAEEMTLEVVRRSWSRILREVERKSPNGYMVLNAGRVERLEGKVIFLSFTDKFMLERIQNKPEQRQFFEKHINSVLKVEGFTIRGLLATEAQSAPPKPSTAPSPLMEVSEGAPKGTAPNRIADFDIGASGREDSASTPPSVPVVVPALKPPEEAVSDAHTALVNDVLSLFEGDIVVSEPD